MASIVDILLVKICLYTVVYFVYDYMYTHIFVEVFEPKKSGPCVLCPVPCALCPVSCALWTQGPDSSELRTSILAVSLHITTDYVK